MPKFGFWAEFELEFVKLVGRIEAFSWTPDIFSANADYKWQSFVSDSLTQSRVFIYDHKLKMRP